MSELEPQESELLVTHQPQLPELARISSLGSLTSASDGPDRSSSRTDRSTLLAPGILKPPRSPTATERQSISSLETRGTRDSALTELHNFPEWWFNTTGQATGQLGASPGTFKRRAMTIVDDALAQEEKPPSRGVLNPVGRFRLSWDSLSVVFLLVELWLRPFEMAFLPDGGTPEVWLRIADASTIFFAIDIVLNFTTGFMDKAEINMNRKDIVVSYLRRWFWLDLIATLPFDHILEAAAFAADDGGMLSLVRVTKAAKAVKTVRYIKILRAIRLIKQLKTTSHHMQFTGLAKYLKMFGFLVPGLQVFSVLVMLSHVNGCFYGALADVEPTRDWRTAVLRYYSAFCWAYAALVSGGFSAGSHGIGLQTFDWVLSSQRIAIAGVLSYGMGLKVLQQQEDARFRVVQASALQYLKKHGVGVDMQIQVLYGLQETRRVAVMTNHYNELMCTTLPQDLHNRICQELWAEKLGTLGFVAKLSENKVDFLIELTYAVREEVFASKVYIFSEGDQCCSAFLLLDGTVTVVSSITENIDDFVGGMWLGEKALVNHTLHRSGSAWTKEVTSTLLVPAKPFQELVLKHHLGTVFEVICNYDLQMGLCGRCGSLGDHFTDACPTLGETSVSSVLREAQALVVRGLKSSEDPTSPLQVDLQHFLRMHGMESLASLMVEKSITNLHDLASSDVFHVAASQDSGSVVDFFDLPQSNSTAVTLTRAQRAKLAPEYVRQFQQRSQATKSKLFHQRKWSKHLIFLSHCKIDAGTEACLMREELGKLLQENPDLPGAHIGLEALCFLDSEDLLTLEQLQNQVRNCSVLALLLTTHVLTRPWCLVEIYTAEESGVPILPVSVVKQGNDFSFPSEEFYTKVLAGEVLDEAGVQVLKDCKISVEDVVKTMRRVFKRIAVTYSPHKSRAIRSAELRSLLHRCHCSS